MGKVNELANEIAELRRCGELIVKIAESIRKMFSEDDKISNEEERTEKVEEKAITLELERKLV